MGDVSSEPCALATRVSHFVSQHTRQEETNNHRKSISVTFADAIAPEKSSAAGIDWSEPASTAWAGVPESDAACK